MRIETLTSGFIFRGMLLLLGIISSIFMPLPEQSLSVQTLTEILQTVVIPIAAPIIFVVLLMDIIIYSATLDGVASKQQKYLMAAEGIVCVLVLLTWMSFLLSPIR